MSIGEVVRGSAWLYIGALFFSFLGFFFWLIASLFVNPDVIGNALQYLEEKNRIVIDGDKIYPRQIGKKKAAACVLRDHSKGLPWADIARIVNSRNISK